MDCPRCAFAGATGPSCPRCGVVFAKLREPRERPAPSPEARPDPPRPSSLSSNALWSMVLAGILLVTGVGWIRLQRPRPRRVLPAVASVPAAVPDAESAPTPEVALPKLEAPIAAPEADSQAFSSADAEILYPLLTKVNNALLVSPADVEAAAGLLARHPDEKTLQRLMTEILLLAAQQEIVNRRPAEATAHLRRATALPWADARARSALLGVLVLSADWTAVESYAGELLRRDARDADAWYALGYAFFRMDRNREATEALRSCLNVQEDARARVLLSRLEKNVADERGMREQQLAHFHVRYDGGEHEAVGREVLRALERHYSTLVSALDHQPPNPIPVILFSRDAYYDAAGAPAWAGGSYDSIDGRIRIPIGGLDQNLAPEMDDTLIHELTHAFVADKSGGVAPREIHEGMAQYMEGHRIETRLKREQWPALADGRLGGVGGFYIEALSLVEYLVATRGQGGMNDLFKAMNETRSVDAAFRQVHGQSYRTVQSSWRQRLQQQYGG